MVAGGPGKEGGGWGAWGKLVTTKGIGMGEYAGKKSSDWELQFGGLPVIKASLRFWYLPRVRNGARRRVFLRL